MLNITKQNVAEIQLALQSLISNKEDLIKAINVLPLHIEFLNTRFTATSESDINNLINYLQK